MNTVRAVLTILAQLIAVIKAIEAAMPEAGQGTAKLDAIRLWLAGLVDAAEGILPSVESMWPLVQSIAGATVGAFNLLGVFKKK